MAGMMRALRQHGYGGPEVLQVDEVPRPVPAPGQVLLRVHAASVNPIDWKLRSGALRERTPQRMPAGVGQDFAGVVEEIAGSGAGFQPGDAVYGMLPFEATGACAEYLAIEASGLALKPDSLDFATAAAVPMGALTAWQGAVGKGRLQAGMAVLVHAAAGNVGSMAAQIAHALGAQVTAVALEDALPRAQGLGAGRAVAYQDTVPEGVAPGSQDIVLDTLGGAVQAASWALLKPGGILVSTVGQPDPARAAQAGVRAAGFGAVPDGDQLRRVAGMIDAGQVRISVGRVLPFAQAAEAQELSRTDAIGGKVVIEIEA